MKAFLLPLILLAAGAADAATVVQSADLPFSFSAASTAGLGVIIPGEYFTATVSPFDTSLGTLTGVTVTWDLSGAYSGTTGPGGGGFSLSYSGGFFVNDIAIADPNPASVTGYVQGGGGGGNGGGPSTPVSGTFSASMPFVAEVQTTDPAYAVFSGAGPVKVDWDIPIVYSGVGDVTTDFSITGGASLLVTYTYTPVPEPASALLVAGSALLTLRRRR
ncbi:MAG: hypothetical protein JWO82_399 [Akkermansiaceae bacterium]|nr:hypothetical protein [Akkermansiaceae bacterium]